MRENATFDFDHTLRLLAGDERIAQAAFTELFNHFAPKLFSKVKNVLKSQDLAQDVIQEVFTTIWLKRKELTKVNHFEVYLYRMAKNHALNVIAKDLSIERNNGKHLQMLSLRDPLKEERARQIDELVEKLPSPRKEIFQLAKIEGVRGKEIAERFNMRVETVKQHVCRAIKFLNEHKRDILNFTVIAFVHH